MCARVVGALPSQTDACQLARSSDAWKPPLNSDKQKSSPPGKRKHLAEDIAESSGWGSGLLADRNSGTSPREEGVQGGGRRVQDSRPCTLRRRYLSLTVLSQVLPVSLLPGGAQVRWAVCAHARFDPGEESLGCRHSRPIPGVSVSGMLGLNNQAPRVNLSLSSVSRKILDRRPQPRTRPSARPRAWRGAPASSLPGPRSKQGEQRPLRASPSLLAAERNAPPRSAFKSQRGLSLAHLG